MSAHDVEHDERAAVEDRGAESGHAHTGRAFANWILAVLSLVGALAVVAFAYLKVLGTAGCTDRMCDDLGPGETVFGLILYGTPIVAVVAILLSFFTARRRLGYVIPMIAWAVVLAAVVVLIVTF
ncbi:MULTISPECIES: hypothetical protein [unclassified Mycobacterium]|uniref:hypothetical protein n=1 Tax=unclassified Mycobacterium TaxID=2642494 RepID=UPI0029C706C3|nr:MULTISPECIES: hypothetical protein [unclassified Mycobacterium]